MKASSENGVRFNSGFSLIETMVCVLIVSILASISYGTYSALVKRLLGAH
ncbi:MAG TPA: prepilin-type N-terminal cleavage/methylation domain-containing protein [Bdellovibrionota bacterium]|nr:prepilin-type N-terminal cleavage/methylation domain-containing protein [Bdellovibrionota bacterium]